MELTKINNFDEVKIGDRFYLITEYNENIGYLLIAENDNVVWVCGIDDKENPFPLQISVFEQFAKYGQLFMERKETKWFTHTKLLKVEKFEI